MHVIITISAGPYAPVFQDQVVDSLDIREVSIGSVAKSPALKEAVERAKTRYPDKNVHTWAAI